MLEVIGFLFLLILVYVLSILCIMGVLGKTVVEAKTIVNSFLKEVFLTETPQQSKDSEWTYGIYIGMDANGYPLADEIESDFMDINTIFRDFYFSGSRANKNHLVYSFVIAEPIIEMSDIELYDYCLKKCNSMVHRIIHKSNPYFGRMTNLVAVKICDNQLLIYIAQNDVGRHQNADFINRMRKSLKGHTDLNCNAPIEENWSE